MMDALPSNVDHSLATGLGGKWTLTSWEPSPGMTEAQWREAGKAFHSASGSLGWWIGDWWIVGEARYGNRKAVVEADDWEGPEYSTCRWASSIATKFGRPNVVEDAGKPIRRGALTFQHHAEVAALPPNDATRLLNWCEETIPTTKRPRSSRELRNAVRETRRAAHIANLAFPADRYGLLYCDPPWQYDFSLTDSRKIENQYPTMDFESICALQIADRIAADNAMLFMWAVNPKLSHAIAVLEAWGFEFVTNFVWIKDRWGMGYHARGQHELLLVGRRGELPPPAADSRFSSVIDAPRGEHSAKPDVVYSMLETMYPTLPKIELFARQQRPCWGAWGNQLGPGHDVRTGR